MRNLAPLVAALALVPTLGDAQPTPVWPPPVENPLCGTTVPLDFLAIFHDLNEYWFTEFKNRFGRYRPPNVAVMLNVQAGMPIFYQSGTIFYNQAALTSIALNGGGAFGAVVAVAHEFGHHIQVLGNRFVAYRPRPIELELDADRLAGSLSSPPVRDQANDRLRLPYRALADGLDRALAGGPEPTLDLSRDARTTQRGAAARVRARA